MSSTIDKILRQENPTNSTVHMFARTGHVSHFDNSTVLQLRDGSWTVPLCSHIMVGHSDFEFARTLLPGRAVEVIGVLVQKAVPGHHYSVQISRILPCLDEQVPGLPEPTRGGWKMGQLEEAAYKREHCWRYRKQT